MVDINETQCRIKEIRKATHRRLRHQITNQHVLIECLCSVVCQARENETGAL